MGFRFCKCKVFWNWIFFKSFEMDFGNYLVLIVNLVVFGELLVIIELILIFSFMVLIYI